MPAATQQIHRPTPNPTQKPHHLQRLGTFRRLAPQREQACEARVHQQPAGHQKDGQHEEQPRARAALRIVQGPKLFLEHEQPRTLQPLKVAAVEALDLFSPTGSSC